MSFEVAALGIGGLLWTMTYVCSILLGFRDKTFTFPIEAMIVNITWELVWGVVGHHDPTLTWPGLPVAGVSDLVQKSVNITWFCFDVLLLLQIVKYWRDDCPRYISPAFFWTVFPAALLWWFLAQYLIGMPYAYYVTLVANVNLSYHVLRMVFRRDDLRGISFYVTLMRCTGTLIYTCIFLPMGYKRDGAIDWLMLLPTLAYEAMDFMCVVLVYQRCRARGINPWSFREDVLASRRTLSAPAAESARAAA